MYHIINLLNAAYHCSYSVPFLAAKEWTQAWFTNKRQIYFVLHNKEIPDILQTYYTAIQATSYWIY